jgi:hypothetical protein
MFRILNIAGATLREISEVVNNIMNGKTNNTGNFTTTNHVATTILYDERIGYDSVILFTPTTSGGATEMAHLYVQTLNKGSAVIHHRSGNHAASFKYIVVG